MNYRVCQSTLRFSVDQTDRIMELINEWLQTRKFRKVDTPFRIHSAYDKELMTALLLAGYALHNEEIEYHGKFEYTLGRTHHIALMSRIDIFMQPVV